MPDKNQSIRTVLIPETGLNLEPNFIRESEVGPDFSRVFAHLIGKADASGILIRATPDGSLHVVSAGVPFTEYLVNAGVGAAAYTPANTYEYAISYNVTDFLIETFAADISFRNISGVWQPNKSLPVGMHSIDFIHYGVRIRNRVAISNTVYEITVYR